MLRLLFICIAAMAPLLAGCSNFGYYMQSIDGQIKVLRARQPIASVIADPATPPVLKNKLERALAMRDFASRELRLPDNLSYRSYADLQRPFVVWSVFAAAEFSVEPQQWCFLVVGCVGYRGYFTQSGAEALARELRSEGLDVFVSGVPAYSTLGWFDDPVLSTFINYPEHELSRLIFHELAHQVVYVKNDSEFNESFAATVEAEGVRRWIARNGDDRMRANFERAQQRRAQFRGLVLNYRERLAVLYRLPIAPEEMRVRKTQAFSDMQRDYELLKLQWGGFAGLDRFFNNAGNAHLASVAIYHALVPQFQQLIAKHNGDLAAFYAEVKELAALGKEERKSRLAAAVAPAHKEPL
jgi:predicted aminopeptidase